MAVFCPYCANLLITQMELDDGLKFICQTCPYQFPIEKKLVRYVPLGPKKAVDDIFGEQEWAKGQIQTVNCTSDKCDGKTAYFQQIQIRSADEPSTIFYKCTKCGHQWKEN